MSVISIDGKEVMRQTLGSMGSGEQVIDLDMSALPAGKYAYTVKVINLSGTFSQSKLMVKM